MRIKVLLITYRRPSYISATINKLSKFDIELFVYSNAWNNEHSKQDVLKTRKIIEKKVKEKKVHHIYFRNDNLSVEKSIPAAIDWFFSKVDKGIVLEDDCIPMNGSIHLFKDVLSEIQAKQLIHINLNYKFSGSQKLIDKLTFSQVKLVNVWGWASNSHTWFSSKNDRKVKIKEFLNLFSGTRIKKIDALIYYILYILNYANLIKTWDFIYAVNVLVSGAIILQVYPSLIKNNGADQFSSNHHYNHNLPKYMKKRPIGFEYDTFLLKNLYRKMLINFNFRRIKNLINRLIYVQFNPR